MTYVFKKSNGQTYQTNDEDSSPMLLESKAHALRVIAWRGLRDVKIIPATAEQVAAGTLVCVHRRRVRAA